MQKPITASLAAAALVAALSSIVEAAPEMRGVPPGVRGAHDEHVGISITTPPAPAPDKSGIDRTFHPDYSQALTPLQMVAAWNAEIDRVFQTPIAGGG